MDHFEIIKDAIRKNDYKLVESLLDNGVDVDIRNQYLWTPLQIAAARSSLEIVNLLLCRGANINLSSKYKETPLLMAVRTGDHEMFQRILSLKPDINDNQPLKEALDRVKDKYSLSEHRCRMLIDYGLRLKQEELSNHLEFALKRGSNSAAKLILDNHQTLVCNIKDWNQYLQLAVRKGMVHIISYILKLNADVNWLNKKGMSCLHIAAQRKNPKVVRILLENGANPNLISKEGLYPLHYVLDRKYRCDYSTDTIEQLLQNKADVDVQDKSGQTALHRAIRENCNLEAEILLDYGADIDLISGGLYEKTPLVFARDRTHQLEYPRISNESDIRMYKEIVFHIFRLKEAGLYVSEESSKELDIILKKSKPIFLDDYGGASKFSDGEMDNYRRRLWEELEYMKKDRVHNSSFSLYELLTSKSLHNTLNFTILNTLQNTIHYDGYFEYGRILERKLELDKRKVLLEPACYCFHQLNFKMRCKIPSAPVLPYEVVQKIFSSLNVSDLQSVIQSASGEIYK